MIIDTRVQTVAAQVAKAMYWNGTTSYRDHIPYIVPIVRAVINENHKFVYPEVLRRLRQQPYERS